MAGLGERASRLKRFAVDLEPKPEEWPYYLHVPASEAERAPGWYMRRGGDVVYLGASAGDAEHYLRGLLAVQKKPRRKIA